jgi:uncharacterized repeat protein (TIGR03806 family)
MNPAAKRRLIFLALCFVGLLGGCSRQVVLHPPEAYPAKLSDWGIVWRAGDTLAVHEDALVYDLNTPLFSDHAAKLRTLYLPSGSAAKYDASESFEYPVGTIVTKTFFYRRARHDGELTRNVSWNATADEVNFRDFAIIETRVLVRQEQGWDALAYVWDGNDATVTITGKLIPVTLDGQEFPYLVPSRNECASCHVTNHTAKSLQPIGLKARHLNRPEPGDAEGGNQLTVLQDRGWLDGLPALEDVPRNASAADTKSPIDARARAYLDANCGHCHNARGAADTSGLLLDAGATDARQLGRCKPPIAAGRGSGGRMYSIVPGKPDASILLWRMQTSDPGARMPEQGRSLPHEEGIALISSWISGMTGAC